MIVTVIISALQAQHEDVDRRPRGRSGPWTPCFLSGVITRRERFIGLGCGEYGGHTRAFNIVIVSLGTWVNSGQGGMSCIAFKGLRSTVQCQRWPVSHIHMHDPEESLFHDIGFVLVPSSTHQPIFTEVHASRSRSNLPSGVANSPFLFLEVVIMCLPVKRLNQKVMNRLEWHLEGTDEYLWW